MFICDEALVDMERVRIGDNCVLHPKSSVVIEGVTSTSSPSVCIVFGERNILDDMAVLIYNLNLSEGTTMSIGNNNLFECGCMIQAKSIGNDNWFEPKCHLGDGVVIGNNCIIGTGVVIPSNTIIDDNSIMVMLPDGRIIRREQKEFTKKAKQILHDKYIDAFTTLTSPAYLPKNHRMKTK